MGKIPEKEKEGKSTAKTDKLKAQTRGMNTPGRRTDLQNEMVLKDRGKSRTTEAGGAPRQVY